MGPIRDIARRFERRKDPNVIGLWLPDLNNF